jgi:hypothetical protein
MDLFVILFLVIIIVVIAAAVFRPLLEIICSKTKEIIGGARVKDLKKSPRTASESNAIKILESITGEKFPTVYPDWLVWKGSKLELDGYCEKLKLALEFSGPLHTKWFPAKEPYEKYFERVIRDVVKKKLCKKNGVTLIVIDMSLPSRHWRNYILSRLFDAEFVKDRPVQYIDKQTAKPYRNPQIEQELDLAAELDIAKKLK